MTGIVLIDDSVGSMIHSTCSLSPMRSHTGDGMGSGVLKTPLAAEQHMACRGSQRGSQETGSLCNRDGGDPDEGSGDGGGEKWTDLGHAPFWSCCCR